MRIAFFTDDYLPYIHGVTTSIQNLRAAYERLGHEVFIIAPKCADYEDNDDHVIRTNSFNSYIFDKRPVSIVYPGMAKKFDEYEFDVVHSHTQFWMGALGSMVAKRQGIPHVSTMHTLFTELLDNYPAAVISGMIAVSIGYPIAFKTRPVLPFEFGSLQGLSMDSRDLFKKQAWRLMNTFFAHTSACIAPSEHLFYTMAAHGLEAPCYVLPNGIDLEQYKARTDDEHSTSTFKKPRGQRWITAVGRLSGEKRQRVLVESMAGIADPKVRLILVGDGPERENLEELAEELGVADRIWFTGKQSPACVAYILSQSDVFTLASYRFDNQPMVILEAIASGLPVVYCDDNLKEGLTAENSILTDTPEPADFAEVFRTLLADRERLKQMSSASRKLSKEFDINRLAKRMVEIYKDAQPLE
ncbi:glycosyltransferase [Candidatus Saccharibacteria bacterium]|nr:glycosyltransferase [Candidatus Saccharibacteria bacterium]